MRVLFVDDEARVFARLCPQLSQQRPGCACLLAAVHVADVLVECDAEPATKLLPRLDPQFIARPEAERCLREWHIDDATDARNAERALAL